MTRHIKWLAAGVLAAVGILPAVLVGLTVAVASGQDKQAKPDLTKIPPKVLAALTAKFPKAEIDKWSKEEEGGKVVYDIEFNQDGKKFEADIFGDGMIHNWEKAITAPELPEAVVKAVEKKYPKAALKEIMAITAVNEGKEALEAYEVVLETGDKKEVEVSVSPDGEILEDSGETLEDSGKKK